MILLLHLFLTQRNLRTYFAKAEAIGEDIYESGVIELPAQLGIFRKKTYLPQGYQTGETAWLLRHMESRKIEPLRRFLVVLATVLHWFNPVMWMYYSLWSQDNEILGDEKIVYKRPDKFRLQYAQGILNFRKSKRYVKDENGKYVEQKSPNIFSLLTIFERNPEARSRRMMHQKWYTSGKPLWAFFWIAASCFLLFFLSPIHRAWAGEGWTSSSHKEDTAENLFQKGKNLVVAKANTKSPNGLQRILQLEMRKGKEDDAGGYDGKFSLVMYDNVKNKIDNVDMDDVFSKSPLKSYHFTGGMALQIQDYNGDGIQEISLGQKQALTEAEFDKLFSKDNSQEKPKIQDSQVYQFSLINVENEELKVLQQDITSVSQQKGQNESVQFSRIDGVDTVFGVSMGKTVQYYQWNAENASYEAKDYTREDVEKLKDTKQDSSDGKEEGQAQDHTLAQENGSTAVLVSTKRDSTTSEEIQSVTLSPRISQVQFTDVKGYYCDLLWVRALGEDSSRYAQLIYNGSHSRTFVIYDTKRKTVYFRQEDGTESLGKLFQQYHENDISFTENSPAIYTLQEKNNDTLKIGFSVEAEGGITVTGSYEYNVLEKKSANLSFSRTVNRENTTATPTGNQPN